MVKHCTELEDMVFHLCDRMTTAVDIAHSRVLKVGSEHNERMIG